MLFRGYLYVYRKITNYGKGVYKMLGIDIGNTFTKITMEGGKHIKLPSRLSLGNPGDVALNKEFINVEYDGTSYTIGPTNGTMKMQTSKYFENFHDILLLTSIALSTKENFIESKIVVGTPVENYAGLGRELKERILNMGLNKITLTKQENNEIITTEKTIRISDVQVFPQGAYIFKNMQLYENKSILVLDWGGGTVDVSLWTNGKLIKANSYQKGCYIMFQEIAQKINKEYPKLNLTLTALDVEGFIMNNFKKFKNTEIDERATHTRDFSHGLVAPFFYVILPSFII